jgi:uncharacterized LabA/DUF88 family protein
LLKAKCFIDYENIVCTLHSYGVDPLEIKFFPVLLNKMKNEFQLNVIESIAYFNTENRLFRSDTQSVLQNHKIKIRHALNGGKNCSDLLLTVNAMNTISNTPDVKVFVIVSSDRDMAPLLTALRYESKVTYLISTRQNFDPAVSTHADYHYFIEDIFHLNPAIKEKRAYQSNIANARQVARFLYGSIIWKNHEKTQETVSLRGYSIVIAPKLGRCPSQIITDFQLAAKMKYVQFVSDEKKGPCLSRGKNYKLVFEDDTSII